MYYGANIDIVVTKLKICVTNCTINNESIFTVKNIFSTLIVELGGGVYKLGIVSSGEIFSHFELECQVCTVYSHGNFK